MSPTDQAMLNAICAEANARLDAMALRMYHLGYIVGAKRHVATQVPLFGAGKPQSSGPSAPTVNKPVPLPRMPSPSMANR
jgi:hypothetical protein